jgi:ATP-dependent Clp protease ATP-binding subunit ClpB
MLDFDKFTNYSQEILSSASNLMNSHQNSQLEPEHIMLAMIKDDGLIKDYLSELGLLNQNFINKIVARVENFPKISGSIPSQGLYLSNETRQLLELAIEESNNLKDDFVGIEAILLGMSKLENSEIKRILESFNINGCLILSKAFSAYIEIII